MPSTPHIWPEGVERIVLPEADSTMKEAARVAASSHSESWILALKHTAAHGRRGRTWHTPEGNFAATLLMFPTETPDIVALRSFVASLALFDTFIDVTARPDAFALKWPNDVLQNGAKVAGILLERDPNHLGIGIGVNLAVAPAHETLDGAIVPPTSLTEVGAQVSPEEFLDILAPNYARWESTFKAQGFAPIKEAWLARAARLGEPIKARTMSETHHGIFETIDAAGNLVLRTSTGVLSIPAAEVYF